MFLCNSNCLLRKKVNKKAIWTIFGTPFNYLTFSATYRLAEEFNFLFSTILQRPHKKLNLYSCLENQLKDVKV